MFSYLPQTTLVRRSCTFTTIKIQRYIHTNATRNAFAASRAHITTKPTVRIVRSTVHEPYFNIALEERLFARHTQHRADEPPGPDNVDHTLFLWCNNPCVILGKHQNPYKEVHLDALRQNSVDLVRRKSGGGCVYQDLGNAIFTFISRDTPEAKDQHNQILLESLQSLGVTAEASGRNDIEVLPTTPNEHRRKVSGAAFKREKGWLMHHGTMLLNVDLGGLSKVLNPSKAKLQSKGITSVVARVVNLHDLDPSITRDKWDTTLATTFRRRYDSDGQTEVEEISLPEQWLKKDPELQRIYTELKSFSWLYGSSPSFTHEFSHRFPWGTIDIGFSVTKGHVVSDVNIFSDSLQPVMIEIVKEELSRLKNEKKSYARSEVEKALKLAQERVSNTVGADAAKNVEEMREWLIAHL